MDLNFPSVVIQAFEVGNFSLDREANLFDIEKMI